MLGRIMKFYPFQQLGRLFNTQYFFKAASKVSVKIVQHQMNLLCSYVNFFNQVADELHKIALGAMGCHFRLSVSAFGFNRHENITSTSTLILVVLFDRFTWGGCNWCPRLFQKLFALLVHADHRLVFLIRPCVKIQQIIHSLAIFRGQFANTPHQLAPGLTVVFFRKRRTLSRLIFLSFGRRLAALVNNSIVQRLAPFGGVLHAKATTSAC